MASDQQFCLRWNNHQSTLISVFDTLLENEKLVDCTLAADGQYLKAHKVVLSACSPYLEAMLSQHFDQHPILILKDVKYQELKAMLDYMYRGEVNISEEQLGHFLKTAESLQIKGLSEGGGGGGKSENGNEVKKHETRKPAHVPHASSVRTAVPHAGYGLEHKKPHPLESSRLNQPKSPLNTREECSSPIPRKRSRPIRPSSTDSNVFTSTAIHPESYSEGNSSDSPSSNVPTINIPSTATITKTPPENEVNAAESYGQTSVTKHVIKTEVTPTLVQPKTECVDYENEDSIDDATLDEDEEDEANLSMPGPSFASGSPGMGQWQLSADGSNDEMFLAAQEGAGGANQNSQGNGQPCNVSEYMQYRAGLAFLQQAVHRYQSQNDLSISSRRSSVSEQESAFSCTECNKYYRSKTSFNLHKRWECGKEPKFSCPFCPKKCHQKGNLKVHILSRHKPEIETSNGIVSN